MYICRRTVSKAEAEALAIANDAQYIETSAKTGQGVDDAFLLTVQKALKSQPTDDIHHLPSPVSKLIDCLYLSSCISLS